MKQSHLREVTRSAAVNEHQPQRKEDDVSNPALYPSYLSLSLSLSDEYRMKAVEEVKYMRGEEDRVSARNQENLVRHMHTHS